MVVAGIGATAAIVFAVLVLFSRQAQQADQLCRITQQLWAQQVVITAHVGLPPPHPLPRCQH
jgi:hypothetical protein